MIVSPTLYICVLNLFFNDHHIYLERNHEHVWEKSQESEEETAYLENTFSLVSYIQLAEIIWPINFVKICRDLLLWKINSITK